ncbi:protein EsaB [Dyella sp. M7H15-1]|uniref:protein EsaB n=1 Tax=Dyella sp. M7H15-1 TaxID=2501295 RepID=UPI0010050ECF|nr:protein EsaB [Dyella sp. M7H15-1]QAU24836.1 protein EsaB [Dyella sp. M7H15-1]
MNRLVDRRLDPSGAFNWLAQRIEQPVCSNSGRVLSGQLGQRLIRARYFVTGLTVALTLDRPLAQAAEACLLLATTPEACDDSVYSADNRLWLLRRYPERLLASELDLLIKQQQTLAALLAVPPVNASPSPPLSVKYA